MPKDKDLEENIVEAAAEEVVDTMQEALPEVETQAAEIPATQTFDAPNVSVEVENENEDKDLAKEPNYGYAAQSSDSVTVQPVQFASFEDLSQPHGETNKNLDILMDIKLQLTVELGRTELPVKKVLELTRGSIIELEKVAGEPVELYANGKLVAHGEVVVIEDNFGLRITSITDPEERLKGAQ